MVANFSVSGAYTLIGEIGVLVHLSRHNADYHAALRANGVADHDFEKNEQALQGAVASLEMIQRMAASLQQLMPSSHIRAAMDRLNYWATSSDKQWEALFTRCCALRDAIQTEVKDYLFYAYPKAKGLRLKSWEADWSKVHTAFPGVRVDSYAATDCYALQQNTASVFHSMRVAEFGLRALAKERRIRLPKDKAVEWATWQEIIRELDGEIKIIGAKRAGKTKDAALAFYSGARADLNGFKDEYRNSVMHARSGYDEFQALRALSLVHDFMARLAGEIDHNHQRIIWGRF